MNKTWLLTVVCTVAALATAFVFNPARSLAVEYQVEFVATWSNATHPSAYPASAHFSPLIGATHTDQVTFWEPGGISTPGIEAMAEEGDTVFLRNEFLAAGADTDTIIRDGGVGSPGSTTERFDVEASHSLVTLVTMVAPSPDWFVGVHGLDLRPGGNWVSQITVDLFAYDAGTDSEQDFNSANSDTNPQDPIALLGAPFTGENSAPLGTFTFTLIPEPTSLMLILLGSGFLSASSRRFYNRM